MPEFGTDSTRTSQLLNLAGEGDADAFAQLVGRHLPMVKDAVRRRLRPNIQARVDRSDIVQETQKVAFERLADYLSRRPMPFRLWLLKTAHERILMAKRAHLRAAKRSVEREIPLPDQSSMHLARHLGGRGPSSAAQQREYAQLVRRCVARLSEKYREILVLRFFNELSNQEVSEILEIQPETARKRFARGLLKLKEELKSAGIDGYTG